MSAIGMQRFVETVRDNPERLALYADVATVADLAVLLRRDGFDVTDEEVEAAHSRSKTLSDEDLDSVTGGLAGTVVVAIAAGVMLGAAAGVAGTVGGIITLNELRRVWK